MQLLKTGKKSRFLRDAVMRGEQLIQAIKLQSAKEIPFPIIVWVDSEDDADAWLKMDAAGDLAERDEEGRVTIYLPSWSEEYFAAITGHPTPSYPDAEALKAVKYLCAWGGRGSGKSRAFALIVMIVVGWLGWRVACCREIMNTIEDSSKAEIEAEIARYGLTDMFVIQKKYIKGPNGARILFRGLLRNVQGVKSLSNVDLAYVDEAENVSARSWQVLFPSLRKSSAKIVCAFNPFRDVDPTYKIWVSECKWPEFEDGAQWTVIRKVNFDQNPWFAFTNLKRECDVMRREDADEWDHVYGGNPVGAAALAIIKPRWVADCYDLHLLLTGTIDYGQEGQPVGGFDPGGTDKGDPSAIAYQVDNVLCYVDEGRFEDPLLATQWAYRKALDLDAKHVHYDKGGVGLGSKGKIRELNSEREANGYQAIAFTGWDAGGEVIGKNESYSPRRKMEEQFRDWKAQSWGLLGDRFRHGSLARKYFTDYVRGKAPYFDDVGEAEQWSLITEHRPQAVEYMADQMGDRLSSIISIDTMNIPPATLIKMRGELTTPTWIPADGGKRAVVSKKTLLSKGIPSHNIADAVCLAFVKPPVHLYDS
jgi:phage terminase large subunit